MPQSVKEGGLHRIFGIFAIAQNSLRESEDAIPVGHHEARKCRRIAGPGAREQILFIRGHERRSHLSWSGLCLALDDLKTSSGLKILRRLHGSWCDCCRCHISSLEFVRKSLSQ
jgi:hypothetical protein